MKKAIALLCLLMVFFFIRASYSQEQSKTVLLINSYHKGYQWSDAIVNGVSSVLTSSEMNIHLYVEYLDTKHFSPEQTFPLFVELFHLKYKQKPDLIITIDNEAFDFLIERRSELFAGIPVVFCGVNSYSEQTYSQFENITGLVEEVDIKQNIELVLSLYPETEYIISYYDNTPTGKILLEKFSKLKYQYEKRITFIELVNLTIDELADTVSKLPDNSILLSGVFSRDRDDHYINVSELHRLLNENSNVPVFSGWVQEITSGALGGVVITGFEHGRQTALFALKILSGTKIDDLPIVEKTPSLIMFNHNQMKRFGIKDDEIPEGSIKLFENHNFYERNTYLIWGIFAFIIFQLVIIALLYINSQLRKKAQIRLQKEQDSLAELVKQRTKLIDEERKQFLELLNSIPEMIYVADKNTHEILFTNSTFQEVAGRDITGEKCYRAIQQREGVCEFCTNEIIFSKEEPYFWQFYNPIFDRYFYIIDRAIKWIDGRDVRFELAIDITQLKKTEKALKESEEKFRLITENVSDVIWILNVTKQKFTYISPSVYQLRGYTPEEAMEQGLRESLTPESAELVKRLMGERIPMFLANDDFDAVNIDELRQPCKNGEIIWVETSTKYRYNSDGEIEVLGVSRDIDERKKQEEEIKRRIEYEKSIARCSHALLNDIPDAVYAGLQHIIESSEASHIYIFENFEDAENQLCVKQIFEVCIEGVEPQIDNEELQHLVYDEHGFKRWKNVLSKNEIIIGNVQDFPYVEREILEPQGIKSILIIPIWVDKEWFGFIGFDYLDSTFAWKDEDVRLLRTVSELFGAYFQNKRNQATILEHNKELEDINNTKDKFFSIIAHDLNNPFFAILSLSKILMSDHKKMSEEKREHIIELLKESAESTYDLLQNLLVWSRSQRGVLEYEPESINFYYLSQEVAKHLKQQAENKKVSIVLNIPEDFVVFADSNMINTVLRNLVSNAIKFSHKDSQIHIRSEQTTQAITVSVIDNGVGMSEEVVKKLFRIDENISTAGTEDESGTGLGLILCKEFVEKHNGEIRVESTEGKGSTFSFSLPVKH